MSYKKIILLIFLLISILLNSNELIIGILDKSYIFSPYYQIDGIVLITISIIVLNILLISLLMIQHTKKNFLKNYINLIIIFLILLLISLIWFEIYYGSTFYYGEIRGSQAVWFSGVNNFGIVGSIILSYSLFDFKFLNKKYSHLFDISYLTLLIIIHFIILYSLNEKWRIFFPAI